MPYPGTTTISPPPTGDETAPPTAAAIPPMPYEAANGRAQAPGPAATGWFRKMLRRPPRV
jgi:hypothetical protein